MQIRILKKSDVELFRDLRLRAIKDSPSAFLQTDGEFGLINLPDLEKWIEPSEDRATLGAFDQEGSLVGIAGFKRDSGKKVRHKAIVWGVFIAPKARRKGIARAMMEALIHEARTREDILYLYLSVAVSQIEAQALYISIGFKSYGREPRAIKVGGCFIDEDLMILNLKENDSKDKLPGI